MTFLIPPHPFPDASILPNAATLWCFIQHQAQNVVNKLSSSCPSSSPLLSSLLSGQMPSLPSLPSFPSLPTPSFGLNSSFSALPTGKFNGFTTEGYLDLTTHAGIDYCIIAAPSGTVSFELETEAKLAQLLTISHHVQTRLTPCITTGNSSGSGGGGGGGDGGGDGTTSITWSPAVHAVKMSVPLANCRGAANVKIQQRANGGRGGGRKGYSTVLEIGRKKSVTPQYSVGKGKRSGDNGNDDDNDNDDGELAPTTTTATNDALLYSDVLIPQLRYDVDGGQLSWHQAWHPLNRIKTTAHVNIRSGRFQIDGRALITPSLLLSAGWDKASTSSMHAVSRGVVRMVWKERGGGGRHAVQLESRFGSGYSNTIKLRRRGRRRTTKGGGGAGAEVEGKVVLRLLPEKKFSIEFDVFMPTL